MRIHAVPILTTIAIALVLSVPGVALADDADAAVIAESNAENLSGEQAVGTQEPSAIVETGNGPLEDVVEDASDAPSQRDESDASEGQAVEPVPDSMGQDDDVVSESNDGDAGNDCDGVVSLNDGDAIAEEMNADGQSGIEHDAEAEADVADPVEEPALVAAAATSEAGSTTMTNKYAAEDAKAASAKGTVSKGTYVLFAGMASGKALQASNASKKPGAATSIVTYSAKGKAIRWLISIDSQGYATIKNRNSGLVLTVKGGKAAAKALVVQSKSIGSRSQKWIISTGKNGNSRIETALALGYSLAVKGGSSKDGAIGVLAKNSSLKAQRWVLQKAKPKVKASAKVKSGWYTVQSNLSKSFALFVKGLKTDEGTPLILKKGSANVGFAFKLKKAGSYYRLQAGVLTKISADVAGGSIVPGTLVDLSKKRTKSTLFSLQYDEAAKGYRLVNVASGLALTVKSGKARENAKIVGSHIGSGNKAQVFTLKARPGLIAEGIYAIKSAAKGKRVISVYGQKATYTKYVRELEQKWLVSAVQGKANAYTLESLASGYRLAGTGKQAKVKKASKALSQQWTVIWTGDGFSLKNLKTKRLLSPGAAKIVEGTKALNKASKDNLAKSYSFKKVKSVDNGVYTFLSAKNTAYAADVGDWSKKNGAKVIVWDTTYNANQQWIYDAKKHTLKNVNSGKFLTVKGRAATSGSQIAQDASGKGKSQTWMIVYAGKGEFRVVSGLDKTLVLTASGAEEYGAVTASKDEKAALQRWRFTPAGIDASYKGFHLIKSIVSNGHGALNASYIVIHETANPGATAKNHRDYWSNDDTYAVHYTLDWTGDCYYCVPENRLCWQVGNGNPYVIGIELCHAKNANQFNNVWKGGVQWAAWQLKKHGWGIDRLISHNECRVKWGGTDHTDPDDYFAQFGKTWAQFKAAVKAAL